MTDYKNQFNVLYREINKSINERNRLNYFKNELIKILDKQLQDENSISKSIDEYDLMMQKSLLNEFGIRKAKGYEIGTIREWKGQKYKKVGPGDLRKVYKDSYHQVKNGIERLKKDIDKCTSGQELLDLVLLHKDRFQYKDGSPFPIMQELVDYISRKNETLNYISSDNVSKKEYSKKLENLKKLNQGVYSQKRKKHIRDDMSLNKIEYLNEPLVSLDDFIKMFKSLRNDIFHNNETNIDVKFSHDTLKKFRNASKKSVKNGFTENEHFTIASKIKDLFKNANLVSVEPDRDSDINNSVKDVKRFAIEFNLNGKKGFALYTIKNTTNAGHTMYALELDELIKK